MADPLSITASVVTLIQVSIQVTVLLRQFRDEVNVVNTTVNGLLNDVEGFQQVLDSMNETFNQNDVKSNLQATGHVGSHWKNLARSLQDGKATLQQLYDLLENVNKTTSFLDGPRKQLRYKSAMEQIASYREQIQSYRAALQLSLSTIILWNQVSVQNSTNKIPDIIIPNLDKLYEEFRALGSSLNSKIEGLQKRVDNTGQQQLSSMNNLRECVRSAADVVSTASSTLTAENNDKISVRYGSDFGDIFVRTTNETMLRWMKSNTVYEFEDILSPVPPESSAGDALADEPSDSDSDIESEMIQALLSNGEKRKEQGDLKGAVRHFNNCLSRISSNSSHTSLRGAATSGVKLKVRILELLIETYCLQGSWSNAKSAIFEKLLITEHQVGKKDERYLWDTMKLVEVLLSNGEYVEAHLQGRRLLRGFKKLGEAGYSGYERCLKLLIQLSKEEGKLDEEEAYSALLGNHLTKLKHSFVSPVTKQDSQSSQDNLVQTTNQPEEVSSPMESKTASIEESTDATAQQEPDEELRQRSESRNDRDLSTDDKGPRNIEIPQDMTPAADQELSSSQDVHPSVAKNYVLTHSNGPPLANSLLPTTVEAVTHPSIHTSERSTSPFKYISTDAQAQLLFNNTFGSESLEAKGTEEQPEEPKSSINLNRAELDVADIKPTQSDHSQPEIASPSIDLSAKLDLESANPNEASAFLQGVPAITISPTPGNSLSIEQATDMASNQLGSKSTNSSLRRSASDSHARVLRVEEPEWFPGDEQQLSVSAPFEPSSQPVATDDWPLKKEHEDMKTRHKRSTSDSNIGVIPPWPFLSEEEIYETTESPICLPLAPTSTDEEAAVMRDQSIANASRTQAITPVRSELKPTYYTPLGSTLNWAGQHVRRKLLLLGNSACGKTWLTVAWKNNDRDKLDAEYPIFNNFVKEVEVGGAYVELAAWDNSGLEEYEKIRRLSYKDVDIVLLCFDVRDPDSFDNIMELWVDEANKYLQRVPKILVGCKKDARRGKNSSPDLLIQQHMAEIFAMQIGALAYFETSAVDREGVDELFQYAARAALTNAPTRQTKQKKGIRRFLSRGDIKFRS